MKTVADVLEEAAEFLETHRWIQDTDIETSSKGTPVGACLVGACWIVTDMSKTRRLGDLYIQTTVLLNSKLDGCAANWNDVKGRTKEEVVDFLKLTAKDLRNEADPLEAPQVL